MMMSLFFLRNLIKGGGVPSKISCFLLFHYIEANQQIQGQTLIPPLGILPSSKLWRKTVRKTSRDKKSTIFRGF